MHAHEYKTIKYGQRRLEIERAGYEALDTRSFNALRHWLEKTYNEFLLIDRKTIVAQLLITSDKELLRAPGLGRVSLRNIREWQRKVQHDASTSV